MEIIGIFKCECSQDIRVTLYIKLFKISSHSRVELFPYFGGLLEELLVHVCDGAELVVDQLRAHVLRGEELRRVVLVLLVVLAGEVILKLLLNRWRAYLEVLLLPFGLGTGGLGGEEGGRLRAADPADLLLLSLPRHRRLRDLRLERALLRLLLPLLRLRGVLHLLLLLVALLPLLVQKVTAVRLLLLLDQLLLRQLNLLIQSQNVLQQVLLLLAQNHLHLHVLLPFLLLLLPLLFPLRNLVKLLLTLLP